MTNLPGPINTGFNASEIAVGIIGALRDYGMYRECERTERARLRAKLELALDINEKQFGIVMHELEADRERSRNMVYMARIAIETAREQGDTKLVGDVLRYAQCIPDCRRPLSEIPFLQQQTQGLLSHDR
jgi:hypothetical protein